DGVVEVEAPAVQRCSAAFGDVARAEEGKAGRDLPRIGGEVLAGGDGPAAGVDLVGPERGPGGGRGMGGAVGGIDRGPARAGVRDLAGGSMGECGSLGDLSD